MDENPYQSPQSVNVPFGVKAERPQHVQYSARGLRMVELLALIFTVFGTAVGVMSVVLTKKYWMPCGISLICLGYALNVKVRRIIRNGGIEVHRRHW